MLILGVIFNAYLVNCHIVGEEVVADVELDPVVAGGGSGSGRGGRVRRAVVPKFN